MPEAGLTTARPQRLRFDALLRSRLEAPVLAPIRAFRLAYLPLLTIYLASGALGIVAVADTFWVKQSLTLTPAEVPRRYEWARPGQLLHLDTKKLGRIAAIGHSSPLSRSWAFRSSGTRARHFRRAPSCAGRPRCSSKTSPWTSRTSG